MQRLGYLGTIGKQVQSAVVPQPQPKNIEPITDIQVIEVPVFVSEPEPEPESEPELALPSIPQPEPEPIPSPIEEQCASPPVLASTTSSRRESFSE